MMRLGAVSVAAPKSWLLVRETRASVSTPRAARVAVGHRWAARYATIGPGEG